MSILAFRPTRIFPYRVVAPTQFVIKVPRKGILFTIEFIEAEMCESKAYKPKFCIGQQIHHKLFNYYGVVLDVDLEFQQTDEWYDQMAKSCPPKDKPWYHVQVHGVGGVRYVAEQNLEIDQSILN